MCVSDGSLKNVVSLGRAEQLWPYRGLNTCCRQSRLTEATGCATLPALA